MRTRAAERRARLGAANAPPPPDQTRFAQRAAAPAGTVAQRMSVICSARCRRGKRSGDPFTLQTHATERLREILGEPHFGVPAPLPDDNRREHRQVRGGDGGTTANVVHTPGNRRCENNARSRDTKAPLDERSAWCPFADSDAMRREVADLVNSQRHNGSPLEPATTARCRMWFARTSAV